MNITRVQIHILKEPNKSVVGYADIIIDGEFIVRGLVIRQNDLQETYVTMPYTIRNNTRCDVAHPIVETCRRYIEDKVLDQYELTLNKIAEAKETREKPLPNPYILPPTPNI